jgi:hypothetical protein
MSHLQIEEFAGTPDELETIGAEAEAEETTGRSQRNALYEALRHRDAWLRKAWGRTNPIVVEFQ